MSQVDIAALLAAANTEDKPKAKGKIVGSVKLKLKGHMIFDRKIWAESTSTEPLQKQLNELCLTDKANALEAFKALLPHLEIEITGSDKEEVLSLADVLASL